MSVLGVSPTPCCFSFLVQVVRGVLPFGLGAEAADPVFGTLTVIAPTHLPSRK